MDWPEYFSDKYELLVKTWGLEKNFAVLVSFVLYAMDYFGVSYTITSGFRSPEKQAELIRRWEAGDPGIVAKPSTTSKHLSGKAIDISCENPSWLGYFANWAGVMWGGNFSSYDPVHLQVS